MASHHCAKHVGRLCNIALSGFPVALQVNSAGLLALVLDVVPLVHAAVHAEAGELNGD